jgi:tetratricopeptide (TPR) repeat protein
MNCTRGVVCRSLALVVLPLLASRSVPAQDPARTRLEQARALAARGKSDEALAALRAAAALHRGDIEISRDYQNALARAGRKDEALKEYRALAEAFPDEATWRYLYGRLLDGEALDREFREALRLDPGFFWAHYGLGQYALDRNRLAEAIDHLQKARDRRPDLLETYDALAKAHHLAGAFEKAEEVWREAVRRFPASPAPRLGLGVLYKTVGQAEPALLSRAIDQLEAVVKGWPETWEAYEPLIQACYGIGEAARAETHREAARQLGKRLRKDRLMVDLVDMGQNALIVYEELAGPVWLRATLAHKGKETLEQTPVACAIRKDGGAVDLCGVDPAKPREPGKLIERFAAPPSHANLVARLKAAIK